MLWMMIGLVISGVLVLLGGLGLILTPKLLINLNEKFSIGNNIKNVFITDDQIFSRRYLFGIIFIIVSLFLFYTVGRII
jgi:ABC-type spermidine/putrescine transport system permease subunit I